MASPPQVIHHISRSIVKPRPQSEPRRFDLTPWDIYLLNTNYLQWGLLFSHLSLSLTTKQTVDYLRTSLSAALFHFYPLAGHLKTETDDYDGVAFSIECSEDGVEYVHVIANSVNVNDLLPPLASSSPSIESFFLLNGSINYDGCCLPLLGIQVTELADAVFLGCSFNHAVADGRSFWNFFNAWAEICRAEVSGTKQCKISHHPVHNRWFNGDIHPPIKLHSSHPDKLFERYSPPPELQATFFHISSSSIANLKSKANEQCKSKNEISSFQALCALVWRSVTRARGLPLNHKTSCRVAANYGRVMNPALSPYYFGNATGLISATATVGKLLANSLGQGAWLVHQSVVSHTKAAVLGALREWTAGPEIHRLSSFDPNGVTIEGLPRLDAYACDFGWGKPVALRSGIANRYDGKVSAYPGRTGAGSVDLEVCLLPEFMAALMLDEEFMAAVSSVAQPVRSNI